MRVLLFVKNSLRFLTIVGAAAFAALSGGLYVTAWAVTENMDESTNVYDQLAQRAQSLAVKPEPEDGGKLPKSLTEMTYPEYRSIRFRPESALWHGETDFEIQLFHLGFLYQSPVTLLEVQDGVLNAPVAYQKDLFIYGKPSAGVAETLPENLGFAGFRVHYPLNSQQYKDEVVVFQGASYFRLVGPAEVYGLSARGLAIDTGEPGGEEFPRFTEFWLQKPMPDSHELVFYGLLNSESITGAYRFQLNPGVPTRLKVDARLFARKAIKKLGIAPLTSMFFYGENKARFHDDFRPEVHDSDGLQILTETGEWIWRPLTNPKQLQITSSIARNTRGFGLLQRDRAFEHYQDEEAKYQRRPSFWIEPHGDWGEGRVELVEIPTDSETNDNIVAYWVSDKAVKAGDKLEYSYTLTSVGASVPDHQLATVSRTRQGWAAVPGAPDPPPKSHRQFIVDFSGAQLKKLSSKLEPRAHLEISRGQTKDTTVHKLPDGKWRVAFKLAPEDRGPVDMRLFLTLHGQRLSEVWNYVWQSDY